MSEQPQEPVRTGVREVDAVITAVERLEERPIEEHVGVFETAHDRLRRALDHADADADPDADPDAGPDTDPDADPHAGPGVA
jgi:hypothetical protein